MSVLHFYEPSAWFGCWPFVYIRRTIDTISNVCHFDYAARQLYDSNYSNWSSLVGLQSLCNRSLCWVFVLFLDFHFLMAFVRGLVQIFSLFLGMPGFWYPLGGIISIITMTVYFKTLIIRLTLFSLDQYRVHVREALFSRFVISYYIILILEIIGEDLFSRLYALAKLRENKVFANKVFYKSLIINSKHIMPCWY